MTRVISRSAARVPIASARAWRPGLELAVAAVVGVAGFWLTVLFVHASHANASSPVAPAVGPLWAAAMLGVVGLGWFALRRVAHGLWRRVVSGGLAGVAAAVSTWPLLAGLHGTPQPLNSVLGGDMTFRTENVTRFAHTWRLVDYTFHGLHAFYPPGWFWLAGRTAAVLNVAPWRMMKPFMILTVAVAVIVAYALWRVALGPVAALATATASVLTLGPEAWYESYSCIVAVTGIAWVAAVAVSLRAGRRPGRLVALTLVGAVLALTYYLLFIVMVLAVVALALMQVGGRVAALRRLGVMIGGIAVLTAVFWGPALYGVLANGSAAQGHYVNSTISGLDLGFAQPPARTVLVVVAVVALALTIANPVSRAVSVVLVATVGYRLLSLLTLLLAHQQLQPHRITTMMNAALGAAIPVAVAALVSAGTRPHPVGWGSRLGAVRRPDPAARLGSVAAVIGWVSLAIATPAILAIGAVQGSTLASGRLALAAHRPIDFTLERQITRYIGHVTGRDPDHVVVASDDIGLLVTEPFYGFVPWRARYAHPDAEVPQRLAVLSAAAHCHDPACLTRTLDGSKFGPVDALVLFRGLRRYRLLTQHDAFPYPADVRIYFRPRLFSRADWAHRVVGPYEVLVRRR